MGEAFSTGAQPSPPPGLSDAHYRELREESGLSDGIIADAGVYTAATKAELQRLGYTDAQRSVPAIVFPNWGVDREVNTHQIKPDAPRMRDGKPIKYESPSGSKPRLYIPPCMHDALADPSRPLWWTEGVKKSLAMAMRGIPCVSVAGVSAYRAGCEVADLDRIYWRGRTVYVAYDSDASTKREVRLEMARVGQIFKRRGARVRYVFIPSPDGRKVGLDDYLVAGGLIEDLVRASIDEPPPASPASVAGEKRTYPLTELGNAERLAAAHGDDLRWCAPFGRWLAWDGRRWLIDETGGSPVYQRAQEVVRAIAREAADILDSDERKAMLSWALKSENAKPLQHTIELAKMLPGMTILPERLDQDADLLNVANATIDLRTFELRAHRREDFLTRLVDIPYDAEAQCPRWCDFLDVVLQRKDDVLRYLFKAVGYSITGNVSEKCFFFLHGHEGDNGKSVFVDTLMSVLGPYAMRTPTETLMSKNNDGGVPNDVARLRGARFVAAAEVGEGKRLNEELVKELTGNDVISARFMRAEWFDFKPQFKIWMTGNYRPNIQGQDKAIWRRVKLIPFTYSVPKAQQDPNLSAKLLAEAPGILAWMVAGCMAWRREGRLEEPEEVSLAVASYREEMDTLGDFLGQCTVAAIGATTPALRLYKAYETWCSTNGHKPLSNTSFGRRLGDRGIVKDRAKTGVAYLDLQILDTEELDRVYRGGD